MQITMVSSHPAAVRKAGNMTYQLAPTGNYNVESVGTVIASYQPEKSLNSSMNCHIDYSEEDCDRLQYS